MASRPLRAPWAPLALALAFACAGCVGTPVPQPPALDPPDSERIAYETVGSSAELVGGPGAALPNATLWVVNFDDVADPETVEVAADGSFRSSVVASTGQELRVQTRAGDERSRPVDLLVPRGAIVRPTEACLALEPALELRLATPVGAMETRVVRVTNGCGADVVLDAVTLRRPSDAWSVGTPGPLTIPPGAAADVEVLFQPDRVGAHEEIVFLEVSAPEADRRPVTLSGEGR